MNRKLALALVTLALLLGPARLAAQGAGAWLDDEPSTELALSDAVDEMVRAGIDPEGQMPLGIQPGGERFVGEWWFGAYMMAAAGHAQLGLQHPELADEMAARSSRAVDGLLSEPVWAFDRAAWGDLALDHLDRDGHDHAVLGYVGVALGLERLLDPDNRHAEVHDAVAAALARRMQHGPILETYPGEAYPVDHSAAIATVALHARATGQPEPAWLAAHVAAWERRYVDQRGLVVQAVSPSTGAARSKVRGSGSALSAWFLGFSHPELSARISRGVRDELGDRIMGVTAVREFAPGDCDGCPGDIDSGPLVMGASVSATGFSLAAARRLEDEAWFSGLWTTTKTFGQPVGGRFLTGGALGNAIMLAMLTAPPLDG